MNVDKIESEKSKIISYIEDNFSIISVSPLSHLVADIIEPITSNQTFFDNTIINFAYFDYFSNKRIEFLTENKKEVLSDPLLLVIDFIKFNINDIYEYNYLNQSNIFDKNTKKITSKYKDDFDFVEKLSKNKLDTNNLSLLSSFNSIEYFTLFQDNDSIINIINESLYIHFLDLNKKNTAIELQSFFEDFIERNKNSSLQIDDIIKEMSSNIIFDITFGIGKIKKNLPKIYTSNFNKEHTMDLIKKNINPSLVKNITNKDDLIQFFEIFMDNQKNTKQKEDINNYINSKIKRKKIGLKLI